MQNTHPLQAASQLQMLYLLTSNNLAIFVAIYLLTPLYESSRRGCSPRQVTPRGSALYADGFYTRERFVAASNNRDRFSCVIIQANPGVTGRAISQVVLSWRTGDVPVGP